MRSVYKQMIRSTVLGIVALAAMIFIPAGTIHYWQGWAFMSTTLLASGLYTLYVAIHDPTLLKRRMQVGPSQEKEPNQKIIIVLMFIAFMVLIVVPPLDYRFGWSPVPWYSSVIGDLLVALSFWFFYLVAKVNSYAAANVRVEAEQKVIDTGVYSLVRHPMYLGAILLIIGTPLALGSWGTLFLLPVFLVLLYLRIISEEEVLRRELQGYVEYQRKVKYRLVPYVW